jgi:hypothetical protein
MTELLEGKTAILYGGEVDDRRHGGAASRPQADVAEVAAFLTGAMTNVTAGLVLR